MKYIKLFEEIDFKDIDDINDPIIVDFVGFEDFMDFLEENGVLDKFVKEFYRFEDEVWKENYWGGYKENKDNYTLHDFLENNKKNTKGYIDDAFKWWLTDDDQDFWETIHDKWKKKNDN
jgi:hypothetical protein